MTDREEAVKLAESVLDWWHAHKYEFRIHFNEPDFVRQAREVLERNE